jgi:hypothetical protein
LKIIGTIRRSQPKGQIILSILQRAARLARAGGWIHSFLDRLLQLALGESIATVYRIQISNDGLHPINWRDIYPTTTGKGGVEDIAGNPVTARHVRLVPTAYSAARRGCELSEFEIYAIHNSSGR